MLLWNDQIKNISFKVIKLNPQIGNINVNFFPPCVFLYESLYFQSLCIYIAHNLFISIETPLFVIIFHQLNSFKFALFHSFHLSRCAIQKISLDFKIVLFYKLFVILMTTKTSFQSFRGGGFNDIQIGSR